MIERARSSANRSSRSSALLESFNPSGSDNKFGFTESGFRGDVLKAAIAPEVEDATCRPAAPSKGTHEEIGVNDCPHADSRAGGINRSLSKVRSLVIPIGPLSRHARDGPSNHEQRGDDGGDYRPTIYVRQLFINVIAA